MGIDGKALQSMAQIILGTYRVGIDGSERLADIARRIEEGAANYAEVYEAAREHGRILNKSLIIHLPDALTDGRLAEETAEAVVKPAMVSGAKEVSRVAAEVQQGLNMDAGLGIDFIDPPVNMDQVNGIIAGICESATYESGEAMFLDRVENFLEGYVDDCVRENAKFQYEAGLSPKIERQAMANCCPWCSRLQGTYDYDSVSNTGNDVFRRHRNCHCQILFNPSGSKRRQNVHSKVWTDEDKADRIAFAKRSAPESGFRSSADPMAEAFGPGELSHPKQIAEYRAEAARAGVPIVEHNHESLGYAPGLSAGKPGTLYISKGSSYSAWSHEMQHMRDDQAAGWSGFRILEDKDECYRREKVAYEIEIEMAKSAGREDIAQRLSNNLEAERRSIYGII